MKLPSHSQYSLSPLSFLHPPSSHLVSKCKGDNDGNTPLLLVLQQSGMGPVLKHAYNLQEQTNNHSLITRGHFQSQPLGAISK